MTKNEIIDKFDDTTCPEKHQPIQLYDRLTTGDCPERMTKKWFSLHFPQEYDEMMRMEWPSDFLFLQKLYHFSHKDFNLELGRCKLCGKRCSFENFRQGYKSYCSKKCSALSNETREKFHKTCEERFGAASPMQSLDIKAKHKNSCIEHFGAESPFHSKDIQQKIKNTNIGKIGFASPLQSPEIKSKIKNTNISKYGTEFPLQSEHVRKKAETTCESRYGVKHPFQAETIRAKTIATFHKKYGGDTPFSDRKTQDKAKNTYLEKHGVLYPMQLDETKQKAKNTWICHYGVGNPAKNDAVQQKIANTNIEKYNVPYACMRPEAKNYKKNSKVNDEFSKLLDSNGIIYEREIPIGHYIFDFKCNDTFIELNPTWTHNSYCDLFGNKMAENNKNINYHIEKKYAATEIGFGCVHIFDWDDKAKIVNMLKPKETLYAGTLELREVSEEDNDLFLNKYHLQNTCKGQKIRYGLYEGETLVQVMTFGKPRYNKNYELELLRLCTCSKYTIVGGAERIFEHFLNMHKPKNIISYWDNSKFNGNVYNKLGFVCNNDVRKLKPLKHWYNIKTGYHITDDLLRQKGFDKIFNTNYGKGTSNEELMVQHGFLPVYDCGQLTFTWENTKKNNFYK